MAKRRSFVSIWRLSRIRRNSARSRWCSTVAVPFVPRGARLHVPWRSPTAKTSQLPSSPPLSSAAFWRGVDATGNFRRNFPAHLPPAPPRSMSGDASSTPLTAEGISLLASFVIRPPRASYHRRDLGQRRFDTQTPRSVPVTRTDLQLVNARGQTLQCSHYVPVPVRGGFAPVRMPVVVYLHGNGSCRVEAEILFEHTLPYGMSVFAFDFSGSGKSDGQYISLGVFEKFDVETVVTYLSSCENVSSIALWGHSMGAATAIMYAGLVDASKREVPSPTVGNGRFRAIRPSLPRPRSVPGGVGFKARRSEQPAVQNGVDAEDSKKSKSPASSDSHISAPSDQEADETQPERPPALVRALVLDSAFASFGKLAVAMVESMPLPPAFPKRLVLSVGIRAVRKAVRDRAGFDVYDIDPLAACKSINPDLPALLLQGTDDEIVHLSHAKLVEEAYPGPDKKLLVMEGIDHDAPRPSYALERAFVLLQRTLFDDEGSHSLRFVNAVKLRGNDAMVDGRFVDAVFLYTTALNAVYEMETSRIRSRSSQASKDQEEDTTGGELQTSSGALVVKTEAGGGRENWPESEDEPHAEAADSHEGEANCLRGPRVAHRISTRISSRVGGAFSGVSRKLTRRHTSHRLDNVYSEAKNMASAPVDADVPAASDSPVEPAKSGEQEGLKSTQETLEETASPRERHPSASGPIEPSGDKDGDKGSDKGADKKADKTHGSSPVAKTRVRRPRFALRRLSSGKKAVAATDDVRRGQRSSESEGSSDEVSNVGSESCVMDDLIRRRQISAEFTDVTLALLGNRSLARLKMKELDSALHDANLALELDPTWARGYQRKATTLKALGRIDDARLCIMEGLRHAPGSPALVEIEVELEEEALATAMAASLADQAAAVGSETEAEGPTDDPVSAAESRIEIEVFSEDNSVLEPKKSPVNAEEDSRAIAIDSRHTGDKQKEEKSVLERERAVEPSAC